MASTDDCLHFVLHTGYEKALLRMLEEKSVEENFSEVDDVRGLLTRIGCVCVYYKDHYHPIGEGIDAKLVIQLSGYVSDSGLVFTKISRATGNISDINDIGFCRLYNTINKVSIVGDTTVFNYDAEADSYHSIMEYENEED